MLNKQQELEMTQIKRFETSQKFRIIVGGISFYTTAGDIRRGVGDTAKPNEAFRKCLNALELQRSGNDAGSCAVGLSGSWEGFNVQVDVQ